MERRVQSASAAQGRQCSPVRDFLLAAMVGPSRCSVGFDAVLADAVAMNSLAETSSRGQEKGPDTLRCPGWEEFSEAERQSAESYRLAALRQALGEAANRLQLIAPQGH